MLLLVWLSIAGAALASEQNLILMVPTFIQPGSNFSVEVHSKALRWDIPLTGEIQDGNGRTVGAASTTVTSNGVAHIRIKIPKGLSQTARHVFTCRPSTRDFLMEPVERYLIFRKDEYFFIQTDKFIYKGGQTVRFRIISLNEYLLPSSSSLNITIRDPNGQKVNEWIQASPTEGVFSETFNLVDQPSFGIWSIVSSDGIKVATANIKVTDFYLPKFEVKVQFENQAQYAFLCDSSVNVKVSAKYTFGKDVQGIVSIVGLLQSWDKPAYHGRRFPLIKDGPQNLSSGEAVFTIPMPRILQMQSVLGVPLSSDSLIIDAYVTESGITMNGSVSIPLYEASVILKLATPHKYYRPGLPFTFQTMITQPDGSPLKSIDQKAQLTIHINMNSTKMPFTPSTSGIDDHRVDIPIGTNSLFLEVEYKGLVESLKPQSFMSPLNNFLEILPVTKEIQPGTTLNLTVLSNKPMPDLHYQIFVRDESVEDGIFHSNNRSMATMTIPVTQLMFPRAHVLVYYFLDDGRAVGDITSFDVGNSAKNKLKVEFSKSQTRPGDTVNLHANGPVGATVYITAVDKSVLILGNSNEMRRSRYTNKLLEHDAKPDDRTMDDMMTHEGIQILVRQADINECNSNPCIHGGTCTDRLPGYTCHCPVDVTGKNCESFMGCRLIPCQHGGTCHHSYYDPWYTCTCRQSITGPNCEHVTECFTLPCQHGGSCQVTSSGHICNCKQYIEGSNCETITECFHQPCQNNGTCIVLPSGHKCQCPQYIEGERCQLITDCYSRPCQNGGTCQVTSFGYICVCTIANTGRNCESFTGLIAATSTPFPTASPISRQPGFPTADGAFMSQSRLPTALPWIGQSGTPTASPTTAGTGDVIMYKTRGRTNFVDALLWTNATLGPTGSVDIPVQLGDTVTTWVASAFAMSSMYGLSITSGYAQILSSLKFFVSLVTPDHIIFGEKILLQPVVYNYMGSETPVTLIIENSANKDNVYKHGQVKHGESLSFDVPSSFTVLGTVTVKITAVSLLSNNRDTVVKEIQVKPQGAPQDYNFPVVIDLTTTTSVSTVVDVVLPASVVKGSVKIKAKLSGEILASSIHGLGQLLKIPTGCGEQTMVKLSPDIYIAKYLTATGQITPALKHQIVSYIEQGYQNMLMYQLHDGSFSTFPSDGIGSTWLTAFVIESFKEAKPFTFVSDVVIVRALDWLMGHQDSDGSFREFHTLYDKDMQGGTKSTVALTAYVTVALKASRNFEMETQRSLTAAIKLALSYLQSQYASLDDNHAHALTLTAYASTITGTSFGSVLVNQLNAIAHDDGEIKYWTATKSTTVLKREPWKEEHRFCRPIDIETSAYGLLTHTARGELREGLKVMKWIIQQRNPNGGFTSTQDTVVALKALSEFHTALHKAQSSPKQLNIATTIATTGFSKSFQIDETNKDVLQELELPDESGTVNVTATGSGLAVVEVAVFYNVDTPGGNSAFDLTATVIKQSVQSITVHICASWKLAGSSGMAVIRAGVPTGFEPDVGLITLSYNLKKKEYKSGNVDLYFDQIGRSQSCVDVTANRVGMTVNTQKSEVLVFDYYNPVNYRIIFYMSSVLHDATPCDICPACPSCGNLIIGK